MMNYPKILASLTAVFLFFGCSGAPARQAQTKAALPQPVAPPCVRTSQLLPGTRFFPEISGKDRIAAIETLLTKIATCQPLPYGHDGIIFRNREGILPPMPLGYYIEYTLEIPGRGADESKTPVMVGTQTFTTGEIFSSRGPERLVIGGGSRIFYTPDHYVHFVEIHIIR